MASAPSPEQFPERELRVASFQALRAEIAQRGETQLKLIELSLISFAALAGIVTSQPDLYGLLLLIPAISLATGLLWLNHDAAIQALGLYIYTRLWFRHDGSFEEQSSSIRGALLSFFIPTLAVFAAPAIAAIVWAYHSDLRGAHRWVWWLEVAAVLAYVVGAVALFTRNRNARQLAQTTDRAA